MRFSLFLFAVIFMFGATTVEAQYWSPSGSLGLGAQPTMKLDIRTGGAGGSLDGINILHNDQGTVRIHSSSLHVAAYNPITQDGDAGIIYGTNFGFVLTPWSNTLSGIRMEANGNVGIACADTKGYKLAVAGNAIFTKVTVKALPWPDYVFQDNYRLRPLSEVEQYIKQHHHLPEVINAEEVEKNGVDLGDNQATLLKKIEELTLYVIEQNKKIDEQHKKIEALDTAVRSLKRRRK